MQDEIGKLIEEAEDTEITKFEDTVAEYRIFQSKEIKESLAREGRRSLKMMLEIGIPEPKNRERTETMDS